MRNKILAAILAFFFGSFGVHRFYLGKIGQGILYLIFSWTGIPFLIGIFDAIMFLAMDDEEFEFRYNYKDYINKKQFKEFYHETKAVRPATQRKVNHQKRHQQHQRKTQQMAHAKVYNKSRNKKVNILLQEGKAYYADFAFDLAKDKYVKALSIQPKSPTVHFNLACVYSMTEHLEESVFHLSKAVENGFMDFEKIKSIDGLSYLRAQDEFEDFVKNGYRLISKDVNKIDTVIESDLLDSRPTLHDDIFDKLKRLGELRDKGYLSETEFLKEKSKLIGE